MEIETYLTRTSPLSSTRPAHPGLGILVALLLLLVVEASFHRDEFLYHFRSVFAAGRAMDKVLYVEAHPPDLLILGNSRADNGFDPRTVAAHWAPGSTRGAFNLGLPGADARVLAGIVLRLDEDGLLGGEGIGHALICLDEALVQKVNTLGQDVFFANRVWMWEDGQYTDWFRSVLRLYGFVDNLREIREPGTLSRFLDAVWGDVDPVGGSAAEHLGYRAGFGGLQDREAVMLQEVGSSAPPDPDNVRNLWRMINLLVQRGVRVAVVFPPLLNRQVLYLSQDSPEGKPYRAILKELRHRGIPVINLAPGSTRDPDEFINAGHLNDRGAQRYSKLLGQDLARIWATPGKG